MAELSDDVIALGELAMAFGRVHRITYHPDGTRPESDTDHTVMLSLIACGLAARLGLDVGEVAQLALIHDLVEVYAGDTATLRQLLNGCVTVRGQGITPAELRQRYAHQRTVEMAYAADLPLVLELHAALADTEVDIYEQICARDPVAAGVAREEADR